MAEFAQTMKDWRRMCGACTCSNRKELEGFPMCPIVLKHCGYPCDECPQDWSEEATKQFEEIVMQWAAEHPEPKYPTWKEWLEEQRVVVHFDSVNEKGKKVKWELTNKSNCPIPADIALKLELSRRRTHERTETGGQNISCRNDLQPLRDWNNDR